MKDRVGWGVGAPHPGLPHWKVKTTTTNEVRLDKSIGELQMSGAMIVRGPYADVARVLKEVESKLPEGCRVVYRHCSPARLKVIEEGRR